MNEDREPESTDTESSPEYARVTSVQSDQFGFFDRLVRSIRDLDLYGLVFVERGKRAFFYCLKFCLLVGFLTGLVFGLSHWSAVNTISEQLQQQLPPVTLKDGQVQVDRETPYRMTIMNDYELILDPDAKLNRVRLEPNVLMVLVDGAVYVRNGENSFEAWSLSTYTGQNASQKIVIDASTIQNWTPFFRWMVLIVSCLGLMVGYLIQGFLRVGLISAGGLFAIDSDSPLFGWTRFLKISCYAVTPVLIADGFLFSMGLSLPFKELFLLGGGTFFVYFIVRHLNQHLKGLRVNLTDDDTRETSRDNEDDESGFPF